LSQSPLALLSKEVEVVLWHTVESTHVFLGLVPEVLDAVDMVFLIVEQLGAVDAEVFEAGDGEHIVRT
jgi:hypothetical protein